MVINLSNLTANVYSLIFAVFLFGNKVGLHKIQYSASQLLQVKHCCMFVQQTQQKGLVQPKSSVWDIPMYYIFHIQIDSAMSHFTHIFEYLWATSI